MVEPLEMQNLLGRTPLVEKTVAAQREDMQQLQNQDARIQRQKVHQDETVQLKREPAGIEQKKKEQEGKQAAGHSQSEAQAPPQGQGVELVQENPEAPVHKLDVTI